MKQKTKIHTGINGNVRAFVYPSTRLDKNKEPQSNILTCEVCFRIKEHNNTDPNDRSKKINVEM